MKKITTLLITLLFNGIIMAQLPTGSFFEFEFTGGSLNNTSSSGAPNFSGSIASIADRNGSGGDAADITGVLNGASVGAANVNEMTLAFWMKHDPITPVSNERILQIYGTWSNGFRLEMDGNQLMYNGKAGNGGGSPSSIESELVNIDDSAWHHIAVRTTLRATSDTLEFDVFLDNVLQPNLSNNTINVLGPMTTFLTNANLVVSPTGNYSGDIDDIYFYKSALTDAEITQIYFNNCNVNIPDANFKAYLVGNTAINTNNDTEIQCSEAAAFTGNLNCSNQSISDLTGIEAFTALTYLWCHNNQLTTLDISINTALISLRCGGNQLTSLDVTNSTVLTELICQANQLINLDLSNNITLMTLWCNSNQLGSLNVSTNTSLTDLRCYANQLTILDVSQNNSLTVLRAESNQLTSLNVVNGNNTNFSVFNASNNSNLTCITVDNVAYSTAIWTSIDAGASFSTNCSSIMVNSIAVQGAGGVSTITIQGGTLQMEATVLPANADDGTYAWSVTNVTGFATIDANGVLTATTDGLVGVTATANDGSGEIGTATISISNQTTGINEVAVNTVSIYPNPTRSHLTISNTKASISSISIVDVTGKIVKVIDGNESVINVSDLTKGIYFLQVQTAEGSYNSKFIKE